MSMSHALHHPETLASADADSAVPSLSLFAGEARASIGRLFSARETLRVAAAHRGDGRAVMVIPGFLARDIFTARLRRALAAAGYSPHGWGLGLNRGVSADLLDRLCERLDAIALADGTPVSLVGWSLGGLYARELAKLRPEVVDRVITLGSPFSGDMRANRAWRLYEWINRHPVDRLPVQVCVAEKPPVKTFALWSAADGIVAPACARGQSHEADHRVEVACRHLDFVSSPMAVQAILNALDS